ncbi:MAG TPA: twin-arginine translocation signal domain-containing protein [Gemmataceae bacterium]
MGPRTYFSDVRERRNFLRQTGAGLLGLGVASPNFLGPPARADARDGGAPTLALATFACDVTPPVGSPLCGGLVHPVRSVDDPLRLLGVILLGRGEPIVLCALDWCGVCNEAYAVWCKALAQAAHTTPDRVALQSLHQHDAPIADLEGQRLLEAVSGAPRSLDRTFFDRVVRRTADAVKAARAKPRPFTHLGIGQARVEKVASTRRVLGPDGKVKHVRQSAIKDKAVRDEPEGLIDPWLKTLSFWDGDQPLVALHYYATHPMSYYGDGQVSSDFCGLARQKRQQDDAKIFQVYFTGCGGNIAAGKYNDGSKANRPVLRDRIYEAMKAAWKATERHEVTGWQWRVEPILLPARREKSFAAEQSRKDLEDPKQNPARRIQAANQLSWLKRIEQPIALTCLDLGKALVVHLPGEPFVEYQLQAQKLRPDAFVCVAGYGDTGPWYIPTAKAYLEGGYEPTWALVGPPSEKLLYQKLAKLLRAKGE